MTEVEAFRVRFYTERFAPSHVVTLRTELDGDDYPIFGDYRSGSDLGSQDLRGHWLFDLDSHSYNTSAEARIRLHFVVDDQYPMQGEDVEVYPGGDHEFDDQSFSFGDVPERVLHGHDNLVEFETQAEQRRFRANHSPTPLYDVIVIGSGMSGGVLADDLSDRGARVLLLEAGSLVFPTHIYNLPGTWEPLKERYFVYHHYPATDSTFTGGVKINMGGGSVFWSGIVQQARPWEFGGQWPDAVVDYLLAHGGYERALELVRRQLTGGPYEDGLVERIMRRMPDYDVERLPRARHQPNLLELPGGRIVQKNIVRESNGMFSTVDLLLDSMSRPGAVGNANLTINLNHLVTQLEIKNDNIASVVCLDLIANQSRRYRGRYVVLAAGTLGSARIAFQSRLENPNKLLGVGLTDHPNYFRRFEWPRKDGPFNINDHAKLNLRHKNLSADNHGYNVEVMVNYQYWDARVADEDVWRQLIVQPVDKLSVDVQFFFPSQLNDNNHVTLDAPRNKLAVYTAQNSAGQRFASEAETVPAQIADVIANGQLPAYSSDVRYFGGAQIGHAAGTMRMSSADSGVVDENQRYLSYDNLYIADLSMFPSVLAAKPSLTLVALTLRLSDTLMSRLGETSGTAGGGIRDRVSRAALE